MRNRPEQTSLADASLEGLGEGTLDVLVVGGGIVGSGVARDAALRGLRTAVIDQADFAAGTSSRSSRLLHGGLRYVAQARIGLVWEASREKKVVRDIAPHLAQPLAFVFPTRQGTQWSRWKLSLGVKVYDLLCGLKNFGKSSTLDRTDLLALLPGLSQENLTGAVRYFDALTSDSRLVLDTLRSAAAAGAAVHNYVELLDANPSDGFWRCDVEDKTTGRPHTIQARTVINATGPWSDRIPHSRTSLRLTKGVHLIVDRQRFPIPEAVVMAEGSRILFGIPWGERVILGTTDTDYDGPLAEPPCDDVDIAYVLGVVNKEFPQANLSPADVISTWSGLRPLVADPNGRPSDISRRHKIEMSNPGWWDITGGKLTTYRLMAEETVDAVVKFLDVRAAKCQTADLPLLPESEIDSMSGILPPPVSTATVQHYCRAEWARHLDDVMIRRTSWRHYHRDHLEIAERVAGWMAEELGWDDVRLQNEIARYRQLVGAAATASPHELMISNNNGHAVAHATNGAPAARRDSVDASENMAR